MITRYRVFWVMIVAVFVVSAYFLFRAVTSYSVFTDVNPADVQIGGGAPNPSPAEISKEEPIRDFTFAGLDLSLRSADGSLVMRVWADEASRHDNLYQIRQGSLLFAMQERQTLLITLTEGQLDTETDAVIVTGAISGHIIESSQYFEATDLVWDRNANKVTTGGIRLIGGNLEVSGEQMTLDLLTGEISFEGQVDAKI